MLKICLTGTGYTENHFHLLRSNHFDVTHLTHHVTQDELQAIIPNFDGYVLGGDEHLTSNELTLASKLQVISFVGTGYSSFIDAIKANQLNIAIRNTPSVMAPAVAEHTIGLLIGLQRKLFQQNTDVKNACSTPCSTEELSSLRIGILGLGEIGTRIATILRQSFRSEIIYHSRTQKKNIENELGINFVSMDTLLTTSDVIILMLPTTEETKYFMNDELLAKTKQGVTLINTAGAHLIDPIALKKHIDTHHIGAVAFDGYYIEPLPKIADDPYHLLQLPDSQFIVTPHTAAKTTQSWHRMVDMAIDNIVQFFN